MTDLNPIIIPTVGRVVWYHPAPRTGESGFAPHHAPNTPYAAIVACVWNDALVNVSVFDANGMPHSRTSVALIQAGQEAPTDSAYCEWLPFQRGQAAKQDAQVKEATSGPRIRSHCDELEQAVAHALATRVAEVGFNGAKIGTEVRLALDALVSYGAPAARPAGETHASRVLYPAIRNAMEELADLHPGFNEHVNRAWNYLHGAFWSEAPAPASAPGLRVTPAPDEKLLRLPVRDDHREEPAVALAADALRENVHKALDEGLVRHMTGAADTVWAVAGNTHPHCDFGDAIRHLKAGRRVARVGWNGKGMWLALSCNGTRQVPAANFWAPANREWAEKQPNGAATVLPCITMKTATGEILMGWLASQSDQLAEDWVLVE